jgi:hypothetical protein
MFRELQSVQVSHSLCEVQINLCSAEFPDCNYFPFNTVKRGLGGVVVSVLATGSKDREFKPGRGEGF